MLGFHLWRTNAKGVSRRLNDTLIAATRSGRAAGAGYRLLDRTARGREPYTYRLQVVDLGGNPNWYATIARVR